MEQKNAARVLLPKSYVFAGLGLAAAPRWCDEPAEFAFEQPHKGQRRPVFQKWSDDLRTHR